MFYVVLSVAFVQFVASLNRLHVTVMRAYLAELCTCSVVSWLSSWWLLIHLSSLLVGLFVQIAWYGRNKVIETDAENGAVDQSSAADGTQLISAVNDSDMSSDDELFGLLDKSGAERKVTNGSYAVSHGVSEDMSHGVQQYVGNMSSMLSGIDMSHSTVVHWHLQFCVVLVVTIVATAIQFMYNM